MNTYIKNQSTSLSYRLISIIVIISFALTYVMPPKWSYAQSTLNLPAVGSMVGISPRYVPAMIRGVIVHPENPFQFDFILDSGDSILDGEELKDESAKLIRYFLASLTMPEDDLWVNLSPYEKDRIIPDLFGQTEMGRDLLAQDYLLKQLTASLMYPEDELGKKFWDEVYNKTYEQYGTTDIPINTFNKVWIVPEKAVVYENGDRAFVVESHLKVMLEEDYVAMANHKGMINHAPAKNTIASDIIREILIPAINKEVNEGKNFAQLRQIYSSFILASWYKKNLKNGLLNQEYANQKKIAGIETEDKDVKLKIYNQYLETFRNGVYDYIREEYDPNIQEIVPRKYFSGGLHLSSSAIEEISNNNVFDKVETSNRYRISGNYMMSEGGDLITSSPALSKRNVVDKLFGLLARERNQKDLLSRLRIISQLETKIPLISIRPQFSQPIFDGRKTVELRKKFPKGDFPFFMIYESSPTMELRGFVRIKKVHYLSIESMVKRFSRPSLDSREVIYEDFKGKDFGYAIELEDPIEFKTPIPLDVLRKEFQFTAPHQM